MRRATRRSLIAMTSSRMGQSPMRWRVSRFGNSGARRRGGSESGKRRGPTRRHRHRRPPFAPSSAPLPVLLKRGDPVPLALWGRHKGSEVLLAERSLLPAGGLRGACESAKQHAANNRCCCKRLLASQPDFESEVSALERTISAGGHRCLFLAKYHCELNFIERYWGAAKKYARRHCGYTLVALRVCVPIALD